MKVACGALIVCEGSKSLTHETKKHSMNPLGTSYPTFCIMHYALKKSGVPYRRYAAF
jgi:hypothetical protein